MLTSKDHQGSIAGTCSIGVVLAGFLDLYISILEAEPCFQGSAYTKMRGRDRPPHRSRSAGTLSDLGLIPRGLRSIYLSS